MKIAIFTDVFLEVAGGIPSSIKAQKACLEKLGHEVVIFCPGFKQEEVESVLVPTNKNLKLNGAPLAKAPETIELWLNRNYAMFSQFDIVHVHYEAGCSIAGVKMAKRYNIPLVQTMHGREDSAIQVNVPHPFKCISATLLNWMHSWYIPHNKTVKKDKDYATTHTRAKMWTLMVNHANAADIVLTPSDHFAKKLKKYGVKGQIETLSNGVADELVEKYGKKSDLVRVKKADEPLCLIWNSRVSNEKRIIPLLKAIKLAKEPVELSVYGNGNALNKAKRFVKRHKLDEKVKFYGLIPHDEMLEKMKKQHLSVMTSFGFDTQGLTLLEAESMGLPAFYVDPDMREVIPDDGAIFVGNLRNSKKPATPEEMAIVLDGLANSPEKIESMSRSMLEHRGEILQSAQIDKLISIYKGLIVSKEDSKTSRDARDVEDAKDIKDVKDVEDIEDAKDTKTQKIQKR